MQETLARQAPGDDQPPLIVLLTPGRFNESYFEHLYLARQLGYPLVEGGDLTVRDSTVFLKTLSGLRRVHAIMRRLDDDFCDPLELRTDSALGVPGLLDAVRQGNVLVANALGSGVLESPGLLGFLPKINEFLFGEALILPSIATWWCGEAPVLAEALEKLPELLIKPAFPSQSFAPVFGRDLDDEQRQALAERMRARPYAYVAQELAQLSQAPVWHTVDDHLQHRAIGMRVYAVASDDGYRVLPGGLTRVAADADAEVVSMQRGGASKDTWVLGERVPGGEQWRAQRTIGAYDLVRRDPYLPSRVVEKPVSGSVVTASAAMTVRAGCVSYWRGMSMAMIRWRCRPPSNSAKACACCRRRASCRSVCSRPCWVMTGLQACAPICSACSGRHPRCAVSCPGKTGRPWWSCNAKPLS